MKEGMIQTMSNDEEFIEKLFFQYHDTLQYFCMVYFPESQYLSCVDDCIQEVFLAAYKKRKKLMLHSNPYAWLKNACKKQCKVMMRDKNRHAKILQKYCNHEESVKDDVLAWLKQNHAIEQLMVLESQLTDTEKKIYQSYFLNDQSACKSAQENETSEAAVRGAIQRIRKKASKLEMIFFLLIQFRF